MISRFLGGVLLALIATASAAFADTVHTRVGVTIDALTGKHVTGTGSDDVHSVPIPIFEVESAYRASSIRIEVIPSIPFSYGRGNRQSTRLGLFDLTYRQALGGGWLVGIGETLYNQHTISPQTLANGASGEQYSRVAGLRFELGRDVLLGRSSVLEYRASVDPAMHGVQYARRPYAICPFAPLGPQAACIQKFDERSIEERAAQVDLGARVVRAFGRGDAIVGIRYLNYSARYVSPLSLANGQLADRNVGILPLFGYRLRF